MAFRKAFGSLKPTELFGNDTTNIAQFPANIIEAFIPGYPFISNLLRENLGFDVTYTVFTCLLLFGLITAGQFLWKHAYYFFETNFMSSISIESGDDIYGHVMNWLESQKVSENSRNLIAKTGHENAWDLQKRDIQKVEMDANKLLNFNNRDAKIPPRFEPSFGSHRYFHRGMLFEFKRDIK